MVAPLGRGGLLARATIVGLSSFGIATVINCSSDDCSQTLTCDDPTGGGDNSTGGAGDGAAGPSSGGGAPSSGGAGGGVATTTCDGPEDCDGSVCIDGYCCDSTCDASCEACDVSGSEGICTLLAAGDPSEGDCPGVCDGQGHCVDGAFDSSFDAVVGSVMLLDATDNYVTANQFYLQIDVEETELTAKYGSGQHSDASKDSYVAKYSSGGTFSWVKQIGDPPNVLEGDGRRQLVYGLAHDDSNNLFVTGYFHGEIVFPGCNKVISTDSESTQYGDPFLAKLDAGGNCQWRLGIVTSGEQAAFGVTTDDDGASYMTGFIIGDVDFGGGAVRGDGSTTSFVAKYLASSEFDWVKTFDGSGSQQGTKLASHGDAVFVVGRASQTINLGGDNLDQGSDSNLFVGKFDKAGNHIWSTGFPDGGGSSGDQDALQITSQGDVILSGQAGTEPPDFGGGSLGNGGGYVVKLDGSDGTHVWSKGFGDGTGEFISQMAVDSDDNIVVAGQFPDAIDLGGGKLFSNGNDDIFLAKLAQDGTHLWSKSFGSIDGVERPSGLDVDGDGRIFLTASITEIDWGGGMTSDSVAIFSP